MQDDVLGKSELESVKLNWECAVPGLMTTRCCGTGTCDSPHPTLNLPATCRVIYFLADLHDVRDIVKRHGYLRT